MAPPKKSKPLDAQGGREAALRLLSRREHAAAELQFKLSRRGLDAAAASEVVGAMADAGWQSDERYAEMLVRNRIEQGYGPLRIEYELESAGVDRAGVVAALAAADADWAERCAALQQRRFKGPPLTAQDWQKQYRFLASRGFSAAQVRAALKGPAEPLD
ncbi:MAG TPA: regulatory protein RecX [Fontimonas sp.]